MDDSPVSPEEIRAAAEVHYELGPEYSDVVVASFLEKIDGVIAARIDAQLGDAVSTRPLRVARPRSPVDGRRRLLQGLAIGFGAATVALVWFWHQGTQGTGLHPVRALVVVACLAIAVTCAARSFWRRDPRATRANKRLRREGFTES